jgi:hypothetical protein
MATLLGTERPKLKFLNAEIIMVTLKLEALNATLNKEKEEHDANQNNEEHQGRYGGTHGGAAFL